MSRPSLASRIAPALLGALLVGLVAGTLVLAWANERAVAIDVAAVVVFAAFLVVGLVIIQRHPRHVIGWLCVVIGLGQSAGYFAQEYALYSLRTAPGSLPGGELMAWLQNWIWFPTSGLLFTFLPLTFPDGRLPSGRWRPVAAFDALALGAVTVGAAFSRFSPFSTMPNPYAQAPLAEVAAGLLIAGTVLVALASVLSVAALIARYRSAAPDERRQIKWVAAAAVLLAVGLIVAIAVPSLDLIAYSISVPPLPLAIGVAILRYHLYDIDVIVRRALVYVPLIAILGGLYAGSAALFQRIFVALTGDRSDAAIIITTLILATLLTPLRKSLEALVERRYNPARATPPGADAREAAAVLPADLDARIEAVAARVSRQVAEEVLAAERSPSRPTPGGGNGEGRATGRRSTPRRSA